MKKKFISTLLALAMVLTLLPVGAFAAFPEDTAGVTVTCAPTSVIGALTKENDALTLTLSGYLVPDDTADGGTKDVAVTFSYGDTTVVNLSKTVEMSKKRE